MKGTTFENELRRIFDDMDSVTDKKYVGRAFYGKIDKDLRLKAQYITLGYADHYSALKLEVLKRNERVLDTNIIRFDELWHKQTAIGGSHYIWIYNGEIDWYGYQPSKQDMQEITNAVKDYVSVYQDLDMDMEPDFDIGMGGMKGM